MLSTETPPALTGDIVTPDHAEWDIARRAWNLAVDQRPALVAFPADAADVQSLIEYAIRTGLKVAPQGTGHNAAALGALDDTILLSTQRMRGVEIDPEARTARVQAGTLWLEVTRGRDPARPVPALGLLARRRRRRLHARRRPELARPPPRPGRQRGHRDRARHARRAARPRDGRRAPGPVLGAARRRRQLRRRHGDGVRAVPLRRGLRGHAAVAVRAPRRGAARLARADARPRRRSSPPRSGSCTSRRSPSCRRSCRAARSS